MRLDHLRAALDAAGQPHAVLSHPEMLVGADRNEILTELEHAP